MLAIPGADRASGGGAGRSQKPAQIKNPRKGIFYYLMLLGGIALGCPVSGGVKGSAPIRHYACFCNPLPRKRRDEEAESDIL
jgi:hypothetical protein